MLRKVVLWRRGDRCRRCSGTIGAIQTAEPSSKASVLLPKCQMPARAPRNSHLQNKSAFTDLYKWQREHLNGPDFILHDGPPYANGEPHMGHAINKIIKDIINRNHVMNGRRVHYVPGWDCHGLPIELKALNSKKLNTKTLKPTELRAIARRFALETIAKQKHAFESWGVMADWKDQCYYTLDRKYVQHQLRRFYDLYERKLLYRDVKPVYWSPSSGTALAEAELEYDPNHESTQIYLALNLDKIPAELKSLAPNDKFLAVIWSTTPWSLAGNQAICYAENLQYSLVRDSCDQSVLIVATSLVTQLEKICNKTFSELYKFQGSLLSSATYYHPLKKNISLPFLPADHVSSEKGTGLVHTAPAHGPEDFLVALKHNIKIESYVNEKGQFENFAEWLDGATALGNGQKMIVETLQSQILYSGPFHHSYPLDWRTKKPVILRASSQWFIDTNALRSKTLSAVENVNILPTINSNHHRQNFIKQLQNRPYWCISRQRIWGTPIPAVYLKDKPLINKDMIENICSLIERDGTDSWWLADVDDIVPESLLKENNCTRDQLTKGKDIMDIWLDSGLSWSNVLNSKTADVYLEGLDQFTGWFQSSLVTSVALTGNAPYKNIFVHGFAVDSNGHKMSKSIGNVISPETIISGGKNQQKDPAYGVDALRWWVARHATQGTQVEVSRNMLTESHTEVVKLRLLIKFLLGCICDLKPGTVEAVQPTGYLDWYMLHLVYTSEKEVIANYDEMNFNRVCLNLVYFTSNHVSGMYSHAVKDRLYCDGEDSVRRRSSQIVIHHLLMSLFRSLAPILPHLVEEAWSHHVWNAKNVPFFQMNQDSIKPIWERIYVESLMDMVLDVKKDLNKQCQGRNMLEFAAVIRANPETFDKFALMQSSKSAVTSDLCDVLHVSRVDLIEGEVHEDEWSVNIVEIDKKLCNRCRRFTSEDESRPCVRCQNVIDGLV